MEWMTIYYKVGELARLYQISTDTLRYYEEQGLIHPLRAANGYREYTTSDIWRLNVIRELRAMDFSMEHIQAYFAAHTLDCALALLDEERCAVDQRIQRLTRLRENLEQRRCALLDAQSAPVGEVRRVHLPARHCHIIPKGYATDEEMDILIKQLINFDRERLFIIGSSQIGSFVNLAGVRSGQYRQYEGVFILHSEGEHCLPDGQYLTVRYRGSCEQNSHYIPLLLEYTREHNLVVGNLLAEILCIDIHTSGQLDEQVTELQLRVNE